MVRPVVVELTSQTARQLRQASKERAARAAMYVPYRRRSASGTVRVATGLGKPEGQDR